MGPVRPVDRSGVEEGVGGDPLDPAPRALNGRLECEGAAHGRVGRQKELVQIQEHARELRLPVDVGLETAQSWAEGS